MMGDKLDSTVKKYYNRSMIKLEPLNEIFCNVIASEYEKRKMFKFFSLEEPNYFFVPAYKMGYWDGKRNLYNGGSILNIGLIPFLKKYAERTGLEVMDNTNISFKSDFDKDEVLRIIKNYKIPFDVRGYQSETVTKCLGYKKCVVVSPTSSGKSLMIYLLTRMTENLIRGNSKILIIVPSRVLVKQMYDDFAKYSKDDDTWDVAGKCSRISSDYEKDFNKKIIITTYQSVTDYNADFFANFECVFLDECHGAQSYGDNKAKCLHKILDKCANSRYRFGFTGTFPDKILYKATLLKYFCNKYESVDYETLLENNWISNFEIESYQLKHYVNRNGQVYRDELNYIYENKFRNKILMDLCLIDKNKLLLFREIDKHAKKIEQMLLEDDRFKDYNIILLDGKSTAKERDKAKELIEKSNNVILLATYKLLGTGWSVNNLHNIIFAAPLKSKQPLIQSIGRGLRLLNKDKVCKIYDIADKFLYSNVLWNQWLERKKHYESLGFKVTEIGPIDYSDNDINNRPSKPIKPPKGFSGYNETNIFTDDDLSDVI